MSLPQILIVTEKTDMHLAGSLAVMSAEETLLIPCSSPSPSPFLIHILIRALKLSMVVGSMETGQGEGALDIQ